MSGMRVLLLLLLCWLSPAWAGLEQFEFGGEAEEQRFKELIAELRCLVCQNQSLADSDAELAHDLREEVYRLMQEGSGNDQIIDFMTARYGDFVLYNPPVKPSTYVIWYGPFLLFAIGVLLLIRTVRQRSRQREQDFSEQERARLKQVLGEDAGGDDRL
jgi:cytochrome c-type biogenesis protein CcmH